MRQRLALVEDTAQCDTCSHELVWSPVDGDWKHTQAALCTEFGTPVLCRECAKPALTGALVCEDHRGIRRGPGM